MTVRYVATDIGNDTYNGLAPVYNGVNGPKKTLSAMEGTPVAAGDLVHVKAGVYRETLTVGVSGTVGNPIEYRGDYLGLIWPGAGGVVRWTGSNDDINAVRANCITQSVTGRDYRTFTNFVFDLPAFTGGALIFTNGLTGANWIIQKCSFYVHIAVPYINLTHIGNLNWLIDRCFFYGAGGSSASIQFNPGAQVSNAGHVVQNCIWMGGGRAVITFGMGGILVKNCIANGLLNAGFYVASALPVGQTMQVYDSLIVGSTYGMRGAVLGDLVENYNTFVGNVIDRDIVNVGANSVAYPPLFDSRWFMELVNRGAGPNNPFQLVSPFDLSQYSKLIDLAGTSPVATDARATGIIGAQREWGALEYDATLKTIGGIHKNRLELEW